MTKYLLAIVAVVGMGTVGCGGNACEEQADRINDHIESCGGTVPAANDSAEENAGDKECTEDDEKTLTALADAFEKQSCEEVLIAYPKK